MTKEVLHLHRAPGNVEVLSYRESQRRAEVSPKVRHFLFDFAEKVILPRLLRQPGQLRLTTGLKFDLNGISSSNTGFNYILGFPESLWPRNKSANSVIWILYHWMMLPIEHLGIGEDALLISANNCDGQNKKNRYMLWLLAFIFIIGKEKRIELC